MTEALKIVIVEDMPLLRSIIKDYLSDRGFAPRIFDNAAEALQLLESERVDMVITDLYMPGMDGIELTKEIRKTLKSFRTPVIMLTSEQNESKKNEALKAGVSAYLTKPVSGDQLAEEIAKFFPV